ncbi:MAG: ATP synthase subunit C [Thermoproteota archaeon]|jgi:V/A-type H+-transporting ATPase subunit K|nr:ATP synthase subunit C [Thermoproteota archaeon]
MGTLKGRAIVVIIKYGILSRKFMKTEQNPRTASSHFVPVLASLILSLITIVASQPLNFAYAQEAEGSDAAASSKLIGAGMAFGLAALGAGIGLGFVGAAGLAAISDNPKMQSRVFIIVGMVESIAIYGIVMMFIILGQE